nr:tetratricopeptide repeat protein [Desulfobulbaceae bacterium]
MSEQEAINETGEEKGADSAPSMDASKPKSRKKGQKNADSSQETQTQKSRATKSQKSNGASQEKIMPSGQPSTMFYMHAVMLFGGRLLTGMLDFYNGLFGLSSDDKKKIYRNVSSHYLRKGLSEKAIASLKEWTRLDRNNPEAHYQLANALAVSGKTKQAIIVLNHVLKLDPAHSGAIYKKCKLHLKRKEYELAITGFEELITENTDNADLFYLLSVAYSRIDQIDKAIASLQKAIELDPEESKYYQHLGFLYERTGNHKEAATCFSRVMELEEADVEDEDELSY